MKETRRHTQQLKVVWDAIKNETSHPTADQIYEKVRRAMPTISLGTVYRNLQKLVAEKKLKVLTLGRTQRFDPMVDRHDHFICERCNRVYDIVVKSTEKVLSSSLPRQGFKVTAHQVTLYGICKGCSQ
jgi:Fur family transcriptional regulator, peroxide stress response regulator